MCLDVIVCVVHPQLKLQEYKKRLTLGEALNKDQMVRPGTFMAKEI